MSVINIGIQQALLTFRGTTESTESLSQKLATSRKINSPKDDPIAWVKINRDQSSYTHLEAIKDSLSEIGVSIRIADQSMQTISTYIDQMKAALMRINKFYPPYPPGSEQRVELIRSFNSFRKMIDQLTVPPESKGAQMLMAAPSQVSGAGDLDVVVNETGFRSTIRAQEVHTGPTGLDIPMLPDNASDVEIDAAIDNLSTAQATLSSRRTALATDAAAVSRYEEVNKDLAGFQRLLADRSASSDSAEVSAQLSSVAIRRDLALESVRSLTSVHSLLAELLK